MKIYSLSLITFLSGYGPFLCILVLSFLHTICKGSLNENSGQSCLHEKLWIFLEFWCFSLSIPIQDHQNWSVLLEMIWRCKLMESVKIKEGSMTSLLFTPLVFIESEKDYHKFHQLSNFAYSYLVTPFFIQLKSILQLSITKQLQLPSIFPKE